MTDRSAPGHEERRVGERVAAVVERYPGLPTREVVERVGARRSDVLAELRGGAYEARPGPGRARRWYTVASQREPLGTAPTRCAHCGQPVPEKRVA